MTLPRHNSPVLATGILAALALALAALKMPATDIMMIITPVSAPLAVGTARTLQTGNPRTVARGRRAARRSKTQLRDSGNEQRTA